MHRQWITNEDRSRAREVRCRIESHSGNICLIGRPHASKACSVNELEVMNMVSIYMETPSDELKSDPNCPECKGPGVIVLFTLSSPCGCLKNCIDLDDDFSEHNEWN